MKTWAAGLLMLLLIGCGGVSVTPVTDATYTSGVRYYDGKPYMTSTWQIVWLPDLTRSYVIQGKDSLVSANTLNVGLADGWQLVTIGTTQTPQILPAIQGIGQAAAGKLAAEKGICVPEGPPTLYPMKWDEDAKAWKVGQ